MSYNIPVPTAGQSVPDYIENRAMWQQISNGMKALCALEEKSQKVTSKPSRTHAQGNPANPKIVNETGKVIKCGGIVGLEAFLNDEAENFCSELTYKAVVPKKANRCCFAVSPCPIAIGGCFEASVAGIAAIEVDIKHRDHTRVQAVEDECETAISVPSCYESGAKIVWQKQEEQVIPPITTPQLANKLGKQKVLVMLTPCAQGDIFIGKTPTEIAATPDPVPPATEVEPVITEVDLGEGNVRLCTGTTAIPAGSLIMVIPQGPDKCYAVELCP